MRFQIRLLLTYSFLILLLIVALGIGFFLYSSHVFEREASANAHFAADKIMEQFDNQFRLMEFIETNLVSDKTFKSSLDTLGSPYRTSRLNTVELNEAAQYLKESVLTYSLVKNFYAVNVFNHQGDFFSSNFLEHTDVDHVAETIGSLPWADRAIALSGKRLLLPPYRDPWNPHSPRMVYGLVRYMTGSRGDMGFIEVQNEAATLPRLFEVPDLSFTRVAAWTDAGDLFYKSDSLKAAEASTSGIFPQTRLAPGTSSSATPGRGGTS